MPKIEWSKILNFFVPMYDMTMSFNVFAEIYQVQVMQQVPDQWMQMENMKHYCLIIKNGMYIFAWVLHRWTNKNRYIPIMINCTNWFNSILHPHLNDYNYTSKNLGYLSSNLRYTVSIIKSQYFSSNASDWFK